MAWRERMAAWLTRSEGPGAAAPAPAANGNGNGNGSLSATLPPWGGQWPAWSGRNLAENLTTVASCIQAISGALAALPATVMRRVDGKLIEDPSHPVAKLVRQPNELMTWADWLEWTLAGALMNGNSLSVIDHDGRGSPTALYPIAWWCVQPLLIPASGAEASGSPVIPNSKLVFDIVQTWQPWPLPGARMATGFPTRYFADEVFLLKDRSDDGLLGRSRISRAPEALACGLGAQSFSAGIWSNGAALSGILSHPGKLSKEAGDRVANSWRMTHAGGANAGKIAIVEEGLSYTSIACSPEDSQLLESRRFSVIEIARLFNVAPAVIGDFEHSNFATSDAAMRFFATGCLTQWARKLELEFSRTVFNTDDAVLHIDLEGLMRGDFASHMQALIAGVRAGVLSADEARHELGWNPRGGEADRLQPQAIGGRPGGVGDGQGDSPPAPGAGLDGTRPNGASTLQ